LALTHTSDPNRPTTWGPDPNPNLNQLSMREIFENRHKPILLALTDPRGGVFFETGTNPYS